MVETNPSPISPESPGQPPELPASPLPPLAEIPPPPETPASLPIATPPTPKSDAAPVTPEPEVPKTPATWSTITLAFSPGGNRWQVVDKHCPEDNEDPEMIVNRWKSSFTDDVFQRVAPLLQHLDPAAVMLLGSLEVRTRAGLLKRVNFHNTMAQTLCAAGAWDFRQRLEDAVRLELCNPLNDALELAVREAAPDAVTKSPRLPAGTSAAVADSPPPEGG